MKRNYCYVIAPLLATLLLAGCFGKKKVAKQQGTGTSAEPDKQLYERALDDIKHGRQGVGRLTLQTLINTYPDSEYLAKAKLAIADSYFKEGTRANLLQAIQEYKDFITFFPFLDEAAFAQMQTGMAHYRMMEKPDRDRTEARLAEQEFQELLQKYPNSKLAPDGEQRLREVQEVLAEGDFRIARFYDVKGSYRAAGARLIELTDRYPLYSQADKALWMLGNIFERGERTDFASQYYARIVKEYPLSDLVPDAKAKLTKLGVPVPQPDAVALARQQKERDSPSDRPGMFKRAAGSVLRSRPDVSSAARSGPPNLTPPSETSAGVETLTPGGKSQIGGTGGGSTSGGGAGGTGVVVQTLPPGSQPNAAAPSGPAPPDSSSSAAATPGGDGAAKTDPSNPAAKPDAASDAPKASDKDKNGKDKESTSKKKKGLRKIIPW